MENKQRGIQPCAEPKQLACLHGLGKLNKEWPTGATVNELLSACDLMKALAWKCGLKGLSVGVLGIKSDFS